MTSMLVASLLRSPVRNPLLRIGCLCRDGSGRLLHRAPAPHHAKHVQSADGMLRFLPVTPSGGLPPCRVCREQLPPRRQSREYGVMFSAVRSSSRCPSSTTSSWPVKVTISTIWRAFMPHEHRLKMSTNHLALDCPAMWQFITFRGHLVGFLPDLGPRTTSGADYAEHGPAQVAP